MSMQRHAYRMAMGGDATLGRLAQVVGFAARAGDFVMLHGDPAATSEFGRLLQAAAARMPVEHADATRVAAPGHAPALVIATRHAPPGTHLPVDRLEIDFATDATLTGHGGWAGRLARLADIETFRDRTGVGDGHLAFMQGDASTRRYGLLTAPPEAAPVQAAPSLAAPSLAAPSLAAPSLAGTSPWLMSDSSGSACPLVLMDSPRQPDGPPVRDGLPYSRIAHLAEDVRPFVAIAQALGQAGFSVPRILAHDLDRGLLLLEHLGDKVFGALVAQAGPNHAGMQRDLWRAGVDCLVALARVPVPPAMPLPDGSSYSLPPYDARALGIETELIIDWYWPAIHGTPVPADARAEFLALWRGVIDRLVALPAGWALRDYHSPNLLWMPQRQGIRSVGIIDFQDAQAGPLAYDLVSLLQDARLDVAANLETELLEHYCRARHAAERGFDEPALRFAYAALGAQRNTKIVGIFARLARRDGKPGYLAHIPRIWRYLARDLAHPELAPLRAWYDRHLPVDIRNRALSA